MELQERVNIKQLDFFSGEHGLDAEFKRSMTKRVRGLFARYNELEEVFWELKQTVDHMKEQVYGEVKNPQAGA
jgi:hypothetical protein